MNLQDLLYQLSQCIDTFEKCTSQFRTLVSAIISSTKKSAEQHTSNASPSTSNLVNVEKRKGEKESINLTGEAFGGINMATSVYKFSQPFATTICSYKQSDESLVPCYHKFRYQNN